MKAVHRLQFLSCQSAHSSRSHEPITRHSQAILFYHHVVYYLRKVASLSSIHFMAFAESQSGNRTRATSSLCFPLIFLTKNSSVMGTPLLYPICQHVYNVMTCRKWMHNKKLEGSPPAAFLERQRSGKGLSRKAFHRCQIIQYQEEQIEIASSSCKCSLGNELECCKGKLAIVSLQLLLEGHKFYGI